MLRLRLTADERAAVQALRRDPTLTPAERDRVEMVCLADAGWGAPTIAAHLRYNPVTVRRLLKRFPATGVAGLRRTPPGPPPDMARRVQVEAALGGLLDQDRTWTAAQLATALAPAGIALSPRQTRKYLGRIAAWRRTVRSLRHKQDEQKVERAKAVLTSLKKSRGGTHPARLPRRMRLQPQPAGELQLGAAAGAQTGALREPRRATGERPRRAGQVR